MQYVNVQYSIILHCVNIPQFITKYLLCAFWWFSFWAYYESLCEYFHVCTCARDFLKYVDKSNIDRS